MRKNEKALDHDAENARLINKGFAKMLVEKDIVAILVSLQYPIFIGSNSVT